MILNQVEKSCSRPSPAKDVWDRMDISRTQTLVRSTTTVSMELGTLSPVLGDWYSTLTRESATILTRWRGRRSVWRWRQKMLRMVSSSVLKIVPHLFIQDILIQKVKIIINDISIMISLEIVVSSSSVFVEMFVVTSVTKVLCSVRRLWRVWIRSWWRVPVTPGLMNHILNLWRLWRMRRRNNNWGTETKNKEITFQLLFSFHNNF